MRAGYPRRCAAALASMPGDGSTLAAQSWSLWAMCGGVGVFVAAACSLWRGVWAAGGETNTTAAQQGAAPDRPQCCRFSGSPALLIVGRDWRAAGELGRWAVAHSLHMCHT